MVKRVGVGVAAWKRSRSQLNITGGAIAWLLLTASPAYANDSLAEGMLRGLAWGRDYVFVMYVVVPIVTIVLEAAILNAFLKVGYGKALGYSFVANIASTLFGLLLYWTWGADGWKTAWILQEYDRVPILLVRSFLVTVLIETSIVLAFLRGRADRRTIFKAVACANAASYVLMAVVTWMMLPAVPPKDRTRTADPAWSVARAERMVGQGIQEKDFGTV